MAGRSKEKSKAEAPPKEDQSHQTPFGKTLYRSEINKIFGGVAGGLGEYFDIDPTIIRLLFVLLAIFGGSGLIIYLVLWILVPSASNRNASGEEYIQQNVSDIKQKAQKIAHDIRFNRNTPDKDKSRSWWAMIIIIVGFLFLFSNYGLLDFLDLRKLWPLVLIALGALLIMRK